MLILGINAYHGDSSACLLSDGGLVAAAEEERFRRIKHWAGFPVEAILYCLDEGRATISDVDVVAINQDPGASFWRKVGYAVSRRPDVSLVLDRIRNRRQRAGVMGELARAFPGHTLRARLYQVEHHLAHLGSAFLVSPFDEAVAVSVDGFGDFASAAWGLGVRNRIETEGKIHFPHSLGIYYQALTQYLGFPNYGDEYKVMGLAPFGKPRYLEHMRKLVRLGGGGTFRLDLAYFRHHREKNEYQWANGEPRFGNLFSARVAELLGPARRREDGIDQRHKDIACSVQAMYEEAFFHLLNCLHEHHRVEALVLAGGCAMNSVANGRISRNTPFRHLYVQAAAGDAGGAIGAAAVAWSQLGGGRVPMDHGYWGPQFSDSAIEAVLCLNKEALNLGGCFTRRIGDEKVLVHEVAGAISRGLVVGWFQGRMEWGPRALGNRSILADPRRADMKAILNSKIKRRESFRPFAPSILREAVPEWFEYDSDVPFMSQVFPIREEKRPLVPAVTHVDGTGRLQTVHKSTNPRFYALVEAFFALTGVPMVLNTSFNENEPIVCSPEEALDCFLRTSMDVLVLGDWIVARDTG